MASMFRGHRQPLGGGLEQAKVSLISGDTELLRRVADALAKNDARAARVRAVLRELPRHQPSVTFQEWLATLLVE